MGRKKAPQVVKYDITEVNIVFGIFIFILGIIVLLSYFAPVDSGKILVTIGKFLGISTFPLSFLLINISLKKLGFCYAANQNLSSFFQLILFFLIGSYEYLGNFASYSCKLVSGSLDIVAFLGNCHVGYFLGGFLADALGNFLAKFILVITMILVASLSFNLSLANIWVKILKIFEMIAKIFSSIYDQIKGLFLATNLYMEQKKAARETKLVSEDEIDDEDEEDRIINSKYWQNNEKDIEPLKPNHNQYNNEAKEPPWKELARQKSVNLDVDKKNLQVDKAINYIEGDEDPSDLTKELAENATSEEALQNLVLKFSDWINPPVSELDKYELPKQDRKEIERNSEIIERSFRSFGINVKVQRELCKIGPSVSQYVVAIAEGVTVDSIKRRSSDLKSHLSAVGEIRMQQIDGTPYIGIEVPNKVRNIVRFREMMETLSKSYKSHKLGVTLGKAIDGSTVVYDLQKMPHLLIAGTTGSGKSILTNTLLMSLLMTKSPDELRLIIVDPKKVDFADYDGIPHLLTPLITGETDKVMNAIKWSVEEMDRRYTILAEARVKNISEYNDVMGFSAMPFIVIIIDEVADLMMTTGKAFEGEVTRIAQKARAVGIHLILATQRPSVNVITGILKGNLPAHVALRVNSNTDSRVVLDQPGAEDLLGNGDMLAQIESNKVRRLQGAFISGDEIKRIVAFIKEQYESYSNEPNYLESVNSSQKWDSQRKSFVEYSQSENIPSDSDLSVEKIEVLKIIKRAGKASASLLQTHMKIGYNKSSRLVAELQEEGFLGENLGGTKGYTINWDKVNEYTDSEPVGFTSKAEDSIYGDMDELEGIASVNR